jgi:mono/diheme cytochrome c family protein
MKRIPLTWLCAFVAARVFATAEPQILHYNGTLFIANGMKDGCVACHGETGAGGHGGGAPLTKTKLCTSPLMTVINGGRNAMPAFEKFTQQELLDVSTCVKDKLN